MKTIRFNKDRSKNVKAIANELIDFYNEKLANGKEPKYISDSVCRVYVGKKLLEDIVFGQNGDVMMEDWYIQQLDIFPDYSIKIYDTYWQLPYDRFKNHIKFIFNRRGD